MKTCPECQANVDGLIHYCDCCGASLEPQNKRFFTCGIYELPQCFGFSALTREMIAVLQPANPEKYEAFIEEVGVRMVCYPEWILIDGKIKNRLYYSFKKKYAGLTIIVNYAAFVVADREEKAAMVATALLQGIYLLQSRLSKNKYNIDGIVAQAELSLQRYIKVSNGDCSIGLESKDDSITEDGSVS